MKKKQLTKKQKEFIKLGLKVLKEHKVKRL
jgi:hypothetical protein